jgi:hypothetical protein
MCMCKSGCACIRVFILCAVGANMRACASPSMHMTVSMCSRAFGVNELTWNAFGSILCKECAHILRGFQIFLYVTWLGIAVCTFAKKDCSSVTLGCELERVKRRGTRFQTKRNTHTDSYMITIYRAVECMTNTL